MWCARYLRTYTTARPSCLKRLFWLPVLKVLHEHDVYSLFYKTINILSYFSTKWFQSRLQCLLNGNCICFHTKLLTNLLELFAFTSCYVVYCVLYICRQKVFWENTTNKNARRAFLCPCQLIGDKNHFSWDINVRNSHFLLLPEKMKPKSLSDTRRNFLSRREQKVIYSWHAALLAST